MRRTPATLSTRQFGVSLGVSESTVKRWVDDGVLEAEITAGGHRRIPVAAGVRFIRRQRRTMPNPGALPLDAAPLMGHVDSDAAGQLHQALLKDSSVAAGIISGRYLSGASVAAIADGLVRPALEAIGELWKHDAAGILIEHRAVETCLGILTELGLWLERPPVGAASAVTACGASDPYMLPPLLASMTLRDAGLAARNLGPNTPLATIALAVRRFGAALCCVSVSASPDATRAGEWHAFIDEVEAASCAVVLGGRVVGTVPAEVRARVHVCQSMVELEAFAAGVRHGLAAGLRDARTESGERR